MVAKKILRKGRLSPFGGGRFALLWSRGKSIWRQLSKERREMRYSGQLQRKLTSELVYIYVKKNLAKEFEERNFKMTGIK